MFLLYILTFLNEEECSTLLQHLSALSHWRGALELIALLHHKWGLSRKARLRLPLYLVCYCNLMCCFHWNLAFVELLHAAEEVDRSHLQACCRLKAYLIVLLVNILFGQPQFRNQSQPFRFLLSIFYKFEVRKIKFHH